MLVVGIVRVYQWAFGHRFKELFPMIITLSTQTLYRGTAYIILKDQSAGRFPAWFGKTLGYGSVDLLGMRVPIMLLCFLAVLPFYYVWLHKTASGRRIFAAGTNLVASRYSGVQTDRIKLMAYLKRPDGAIEGFFWCPHRLRQIHHRRFEMQAIAIAILGASTSGGAAAWWGCCWPLS